MALRQFYIGSLGPFYFDSTVLVLDPDGLFPTTNQHALVTEGQLIVEEQPSIPFNVSRFQDLIDTEIKLESQSFFYALEF